MKEFYSLDYYKDVRHCHSFFGDDGALKIEPIDDASSAAEIENFVDQRGRLLEIGAAMGRFLSFMQSRGWEAQGIELSAGAVEIARRHFNVEIFCGALEEFQTDQKFDAICTFQTLEHVPDPAYVIGRAYQLLKPRGVFLVEVPNLNGFDIKIDKRLRELIYDLPRHLHHFSPEVLTAKLRAAGFSILKVDLYHPNFVVSLAELYHRLTRRGRAVNHGQAMSPDHDGDAKRRNGFPPLARSTTNWKTRMLSHISQVFPGWRFKVIARREGA